MTDRLADRPLPRLGVVHAPYAAASLRDLVRAARNRCAVVVLMRHSVAAAHPPIVAAAKRFFEVRTVPDQVCGTDLADAGLDGVTTFHDDELAHADRVAADLRLAGATASPAPWDKLEQRRLLRAAKLTRLDAVPVGSAADLRAALDVVGLPAVLKPRRGTSSVGVSFLLTAADVERQLHARSSWRGLVLETYAPSAPHPSGVSWLADYVSVETVSDRAGRHHVAVFDKIPISVSADQGSPLDLAVRETGDVLPSRLPAAVRRAAFELTSRALDRLGVSQRVTHTELKISSEGLEVIEVNGRLGGEVSRMVSTVGGPDMTAAALSVALNDVAELPQDPRPTSVACLYVPFPRREGLVVSDVTPADLRRLPGVVAVDAVAVHGRPRAETSYRAAKVTVQADDLAGLDAAVAAVLDGIGSHFAADGVQQDAWLRRTHAHLTGSPIVEEELARG